MAIPVAVSQLRSLRFRARKASRKGKEPGQVYHDLHVLGQVKPQAPVPPAPQAAAARQWPEAPLPEPKQAPVREPLAREAQQQQAPVYADESDIPF